MHAPRKKRKLLQKLLLAAVIILIFLSIGLAAFHRTEWQTPADAKLLKNPLPVNGANLDAARPVYNEYCANCHGDAGKGDGSDAMMYDPAPSDLTDAKHVTKLSDGEIYYQITQGKKPMPSFRNKLTVEQRWQLVILVRAFSGAVALPPPPAKIPESPAPPKPETPKKQQPESKNAP
jgi:mono/diheme cytochrome c family protein